MNTDILASKYERYKQSLDHYLTQPIADALIAAVGGEQKVMTASFATNKDSGLAYDGSFVQTTLMLTKYAVEINNLLPDEKKANKEELIKVCLISQISKVVMFEPNTNQWEVTNRGILYGFNEGLEGALRPGERSILICNNAGVKFTAHELEGMRILDKGNDDNYAKFFSCALATIVKQANELITLTYSEKIK